MIVEEWSVTWKTRPMFSLWMTLKSPGQSLGFRFFSSTPINEAGYKMKSHSGAKKRWRSLASGSSFKRVRSSYAIWKDSWLLSIRINRERLSIRIWTLQKALHKRTGWALLPIRMLLNHTSWRNCFFLMVQIDETYRYMLVSPLNYISFDS